MGGAAPTCEPSSDAPLPALLSSAPRGRQAPSWCLLRTPEERSQASLSSLSAIGWLRGPRAQRGHSYYWSQDRSSGQFPIERPGPLTLWYLGNVDGRQCPFSASRTSG